MKTLSEGWNFLDFLDPARHLKHSPRYVNLPPPQAEQLRLVSIILREPVGVGAAKTEIRGGHRHCWTN